MKGVIISLWGKNPVKKIEQLTGLENSYTELSPIWWSTTLTLNVDHCVGNYGARCVDPIKFGGIIVNKLDLIHWITDQLLAILVINR